MVRQGYIIWADFDPVVGYEQKGRRPALVISNEVFSSFSKLAIVCPITNTDKNLPYYVKLDNRTKTGGVILCDHLRSVDVGTRGYRFIEVIPKDILTKVVDIIGLFIEV
jgi:mRNA interferase MazF